MLRGQRGNFGQDGIFNDHRESGPRFNVSSEGRIRNQLLHSYLEVSSF